jgi:alpha-L-fucosidase 2
VGTSLYLSESAVALLAASDERRLRDDATVLRLLLEDLLPIRKAITKAWFGHEGAYYRENIEPTGGERDCGRTGKPPKTKPGENKGEGYYHSYYFTCGLETVAMMIDYVKYSDDEAFRDQVLVPFAREVLQFFDQHYGRDPDGKIRLDPAMVLETWWIAVNPAPDVAGLQHCLDELLAMGVGTADRSGELEAFPPRDSGSASPRN